MTEGLRLVYVETGEVVVARLEVADRFLSRFRGLQFRSPLADDSGLLLVPCSSIHTYFVREAIDVVFLDATGQVIAVFANVPPGRPLVRVGGAYATLELPSGTSTLRPGDRLRIDIADIHAVPRSLRFLHPDNVEPLVRSTSRVWLAAVVVCLCGALAYASSFRGVFLLDDFDGIVNNPNLRRPWPTLDDWLASRAVVTESFRLNIAIGGFQTRGFHLVNLLIHLAAALTLLGIVRRSLVRSLPAEAPSLALATFVAILWTVHPLQTQAVTYISQRAESLAALFYLLCLYGLIRAHEDGRRSWLIVVLAAFVLGLRTKETILTAPIALVLFDRAFLSGSFVNAVKSRPGFYAALFALLALGVSASLHPVVASGSERPSVGFALDGLTPTTYLATQATVIPHYLRLAVWPDALCFDYFDWPIARNWADAAVPLSAMAMLVIATVIAIVRFPRAGFAAGWFFVTLAPSSSLLPIADVAWDYRPYLALAGPITLAVVAVFLLADRLGRWRRLAFALGVVVVIALGSATVLRNRDYWDAVQLWNVTVETRPNNARAHLNLGLAHLRRGDNRQAIVHFDRVLAIGPSGIGLEVYQGSARRLRTTAMSRLLKQ